MRLHRSLALTLLLAACGGGVPRIENTTFAPNLNVDLKLCTRTPEGIYWRDTTVGTGPAVANGDNLQVYYEGATPDGRTFAATQIGDPPFFFKLGGGEVIPGWDLGLVGARMGGVRQLIIPPALGYGDQQQGNIPPNSILVFYVYVLQTVEAATFAPALGVDLSKSVQTRLGVYYRDIETGTGPVISTGQTLQVSYTGWLIDGSQFDSNSAFSFVFGTGNVIAGWDEGLGGAHVGTTRQLVIPSWLGYGALDQPDKGIPANSILVFNVQILSAQ